LKVFDYKILLGPLDFLSYSGSKFIKIPVRAAIGQW